MPPRGACGSASRNATSFSSIAEKTPRGARALSGSGSLCCSSYQRYSAVWLVANGDHLRKSVALHVRVHSCSRFGAGANEERIAMAWHMVRMRGLMTGRVGDGGVMFDFRGLVGLRLLLYAIVECCVGGLGGVERCGNCSDIGLGAECRVACFSFCLWYLVGLVEAKVLGV